MKKYIIFLASCLLLVVGCSQETDEVGVVARVNGKPIFLKQLESNYDLSHLGWAGGVSPSLGTVKREYNKILSELIVQELIFQVLAEKGMPVTKDELNRAEAEVRMDYPKGQFEQVLVEEYIDLDAWRDQLKAHLAYEKFLTRILRPKIKIDFKEAEEYYQTNRTKFSLPERVHFALLTSQDKEALEKALAAYQSIGNLERLQSEVTGVTVREVKMPVEQIPERWSRVLAKLQDGQASALKAASVGFEALILLEKLAPMQLGPTQAYPLVEKILIEEKLGEAYKSWLENEIQDAAIYVSEILMEGEEQEENPKPTPNPESQE